MTWNPDTKSLSCDRPGCGWRYGYMDPSTTPPEQRTCEGMRETAARIAGWKTEDGDAMGEGYMTPVETDVCGDCAAKDPPAP